MLALIGVERADGAAITESTESIRQLRSIFPQSRIVIVSENCDQIDMQQVMTLADAYVVDLGSRDILLKLLELALLDQHVTVLPRSKAMPSSRAETDQCLSAEPGPIARDLTAASGTRADHPPFSPRERQILSNLAEGDSNKQIARAYDITESTVKVHLKAIMRKITAHNRTQAAIWAVTKGFAYTHGQSGPSKPAQHPHTPVPPAQIANGDGGNVVMMRNGKINGQRQKP